MPENIDREPSIQGKSGGYAERDCWTCRRQRFSVERKTPSVCAASSRDSLATDWSGSTRTRAFGRRSR
jgi:hypothetical protein